MKLLRELMNRQHQLGFLSEETLREMSREQRVPLYRLQGLVSFYPAFRQTPPQRWTVQVCRDACCEIARRDRALIEQLADRDDVEVQEVSCLGRCDAAPAVCINETPVAPLTANDVEELRGHFNSDQQTTDPATPPPADWKCDLYKAPADRYRTVRELAAKAAEFSETCVQSLKATNLTGRGGAGFPTGLKWELVAKENSDTKYVICNADESEPGTFKDREILRRAPHLVVEGMLLGGLTIGAETGIVYLRHEYGPEGTLLQAAIDDAQRRGILGENAAGYGRRFQIEIFVSPGGYILGEETALLEALEDRRGEPRNKPPYPGQIGLRGKPTLINNVETFALVPSIVANGPQWWAEQGVADYEGLKFVCISGDVQTPGVFEVPMGTTFAEVLERAGGMRDNVALKAFLPGGASSLFLKPDQLITPIDFQAVKTAGSMLGTGAIMVFGQQRNLFHVATNLTRFFRNESCGKCVPCRIGTTKAVGILNDVAAGRLENEQLDLLAPLHETLQETSICGLGQVALAPVLSMLKHFPEEVPSHVDNQ